MGAPLVPSRKSINARATTYEPITPVEETEAAISGGKADIPYPLFANPNLALSV